LSVIVISERARTELQKVSDDGAKAVKLFVVVT